MKKIIFQFAYNVPDEYLWVAVNRNGLIVGFFHAPIRDYSYGEWIDSVDGSTGEIIQYDGWETSVREVNTLIDRNKENIGVWNKRRQIKNSEEFRERDPKNPKRRKLL